MQKIWLVKVLVKLGQRPQKKVTRGTIVPLSWQGDRETVQEHVDQLVIDMWQVCTGLSGPMRDLHVAVSHWSLMTMVY